MKLSNSLNLVSSINKNELNRNEFYFIQHVISLLNNNINLSLKQSQWLQLIYRKQQEKSYIK